MNIDLQSKKSLLAQEKILKQTDKCFILAIDPETKLPFMINMGLKMADICDLDNRPGYMKNKEKEMDMQRQDSSYDDLSLHSMQSHKGEKSSHSMNKDTVLDDYHPILDPKNYPFY